MKSLKWFDENFEETLLVILLFSLAVVMGVQVFFRYVLQSSLTWSEEIARYLFIWSGFLSIGYGVRKRLGLRVDMVLNALPPRAALAVQAVALLLEMALFVYLLPFAYRILAVAVSTGRLSPASQVPMWMMQSAPLVGFALASIRVFQRLILEIAGREKVQISESEAASLYVDEAKNELGAGHGSEESVRSSWTYRWTRGDPGDGEGGP